ncbi:hypothetical protein GQ54DRAFT_76680 [Martensiomyces pterosporus]|nr:hypothetical protein GQ54DRAFT_76680 [Martensiomyces pterosporus]
MYWSTSSEDTRRVRRWTRMHARKSRLALLRCIVSSDSTKQLWHGIVYCTYHLMAMAQPHAAGLQAATSSDACCREFSAWA